MTKKPRKLTMKEREDELVTRGILKVELKKLDSKFVTKKEFNEHTDLMSRSFGMVMDAIAGIRTELREMRQETGSMYAGIHRNEKDIVSLDERVLKLERAK